MNETNTVPQIADNNSLDITREQALLRSSQKLAFAEIMQQLIRECRPLWFNNIAVDGKYSVIDVDFLDDLDGTFKGKLVYRAKDDNKLRTAPFNVRIIVEPA